MRWPVFAERNIGDQYSRRRRNDDVPSVPAAIAKLVVRENKDVIGEYLVHKQSMTIGRNPDNDVCIDDTVVSSYHARIVTQGENSYVYDLNSTNGTFVNSRPVKRDRILKHGDVITITKYQIKYTVEGTLSEPAEVMSGQRKTWEDTLNPPTLALDDVNDLN